MPEDVVTPKSNPLFSALESTFKKIGFQKEQIISMGITAGSYLVGNPSGDLPRIICALDGDNNFKLEYSNFSKTTQTKLLLLLNELAQHSLIFIEGELVDESDGSILDDFNEIPKSLFDYSTYFNQLISENEEYINSLKIYITFNYSEKEKDSKTKFDPKNSIEKVTINKSIKKSNQQDDQSLILDFISQRSTKSIQSRHLLELFPNASKNDCLHLLKEMSEQGQVIQRGSWFKLIKE